MVSVLKIQKKKAKDFSSQLYKITAIVPWDQKSHMHVLMHFIHFSRWRNHLASACVVEKTRRLHFQPCLSFLTRT